LKTENSPVWPKWLADLSRLLPIRSQFAVSGEIRDLVMVPSPQGPMPVPLLHALWLQLKGKGYSFMLVHDPVDGIRVFPSDPETVATAHGALPDSGLESGRNTVQMAGTLIDVMRSLTRLRNTRAAMVMDFASRLTADAGSLATAERSFFIACEKLSLEAAPALPPGSDGGPLFNPVVWLLNRAQDLPSWLLLDSERVSTVHVSLPDFDTREIAAHMLADRFGGRDSATPDVMRSFGRSFASGTDGMTLQAMTDVASLAYRNEFRIDQLDDALRAFKIGRVDNPWKGLSLRQKIGSAIPTIEDRLKGQSQAVTKSVDILMRSVMGLTGAQSRGNSARPRGVLFFAGPTGVGKTELAKALTRILFGDENAYIRFDMSEFAQEHSSARLLGAPPGYVGYDAGGELTDAVRQRPFSLVLFDEIEKAHPRILDKFLQILEDGRLTDGQGGTTYFSEAVIVFTSNLGIYVRSEDGRSNVQNVRSGDPYEQVERKVREAIARHFRETLSRPEILNRIGENVVVFNFITPPVAQMIFEGMLKNVVDRVMSEHGAELDIPQPVQADLAAWCTADLSNGGRGIGNQMEQCLINPLARAMFRLPGNLAGTRIQITRATVEEMVFSVELEVRA